MNIKKRTSSVKKTSDYLQVVGEIVRELDRAGFNPVLIGGMALVILGSRRVTRDFDFLVSFKEEEIESLVRIFYKKGLHLVSRLNPGGEVIRTIDNQRVAAARLKIDSPVSAYFFDSKSGLKIDLLFDFPLPARELIGRSEKIRVRSQVLRIASLRDLIRLKEIAVKDRKEGADQQDLQFLKNKSR